MDINATTYGIFALIWLILAIPLIIYLAIRKEVNTGLTIFWGLLLVTFPIINIIFIFLLSRKPDKVSSPAGLVQ